MSDSGRSIGGNADEDRLPWLEPVEDETAEEGVSAGRLLAGLVVALIALGLVVGGVYWIKQRAGSGDAGGGPTTITAQSGPYKTKPADAGGMQVKGQGDSSYAASEGADPNARIDLSRVPETPVAKGAPAPAAAAPQPAPVAAPTPAKPVEVAKAPAPVPAPAQPAPVQAASAPATAPVAGGTIQLGALDSNAKAEAAWKSLSGRFAYLGALNHSVVQAQVGGKTYYRLRATAGGQASSICSKLKVAGEACAVVG